MELRAEQNLETLTKGEGCGLGRVRPAEERARGGKGAARESTLRVGPGSAREVDCIVALQACGGSGSQSGRPAPRPRPAGWQPGLRTVWGPRGALRSGLAAPRGPRRAGGARSARAEKTLGSRRGHALLGPQPRLCPRKVLAPGDRAQPLERNQEDRRARRTPPGTRTEVGRTPGARPARPLPPWLPLRAGAAGRRLLGRARAGGRSGGLSGR